MPTLSVDERVFANLGLYERGIEGLEEDKTVELEDIDQMYEVLIKCLMFCEEEGAMARGYFCHPIKYFDVNYLVDAFEFYEERMSIYCCDMLVALQNCKQMTVYLPSSESTSKDKIAGYDLIRIKLEYLNDNLEKFYSVFDFHI